MWNTAFFKCDICTTAIHIHTDCKWFVSQSVVAFLKGGKRGIPLEYELEGRALNKGLYVGVGARAGGYQFSRLAYCVYMFLRC